MSFTLTFGQEGNCATAQVVWSVDGQTYNFRSDNNFVSWISTIFTVADVVNGGGGDLLISSDQLPPVQGGVGNLWAEYGTASSVVGNARGEGAVDWQQFRNLATQVASGNYATVGGGYNNTASGSRSTVAGGEGNTASGDYATAGGGRSNTASGGNSTVGGGQSSIASGVNATVAGGLENTASANYATVSGGQSNTASGVSSTVGGGYNNQATGQESTIGGGVGNTTNNAFSTVGGGENNDATAQGSVVGGGGGNTASGNYATVGGGNTNTASGGNATVGGGLNNTASGGGAFVGGGYENTASGYKCATIGGGKDNTASGSYATVGGGNQNTASAYYATVGGGRLNSASGAYATVIGGQKALASRWGMVAHANTQFSAKGDAQAVEFIASNVTVGATSEILYLDGFEQGGVFFTIRNNTVLSGICTISGFSTTGAKVGLYQRSISIKNVGGTTTLVHVSTISTDHEDDATWNVTITADNVEDALQILCLGSAGDTVRWVAVFRGLEIGRP
jgi:hypothetical protein